MALITDFERARVLELRAQQIADGARVFVRVNGLTDPLQISRIEMLEGKIPGMIRSYKSNGSYEEWPCAMHIF
ncbi:RNA polymerase Rpb6 [Trichodelitschia bisporula]|uniref:RNA polymerase Rpb6 n=1 Tax=Trichodelitschia bisporula TaxID=703511 RepID=A0A6G1HUN9_9PEZI|nr:RNA polymerase Rpb6 [Trichodelitschia bisporula]